MKTKLKPNQFVAYRGPRGGLTIATVLYIFRCQGRWYGSYGLSRPNNGVRYCKGLIPERLARRNRKLWTESCKGDKPTRKRND